VKREDLPSSEALASIGLAAAGIVAGLVARALVLGGKVVAAGLETVEHVLAGDRPSGSPSSATVTDLRERRDERAAEDIEAAPWADGVDVLPTEPDFAAFEPADGLTSTTARSAPRRSAAGAGRTAARPRPAKRATGRSVPPALRPVRGGSPVPDAEPSAPTPEPVKDAAGVPDRHVTTTTTAAKTSAGKRTAAKGTAAKRSAAKGTAAKKSAAKSAATRATTTQEAATTNAVPAEPSSPVPPAPAEPSTSVSAAAPSTVPPEASSEAPSTVPPEASSEASPDTSTSPAEPAR
jgi:hypothetical protein